MSIITFLKKRYKEHLLKKIDELNKLADSYFESANSSKEMVELINEQWLPSYQTITPFFMHYNPFLLDVPTPISVFHMYSSNYLYYSSRYNCTKIKIDNLERRIEQL